jgi:hypothetical protein
MEPFHVDETAKKTVQDMKAQTGMEPGSQTGLCHLVVTGALTGADIDFTVDVTKDNQIKIESESGLINYPIIVEGGILMSDAVETILNQQEVPMKALLLTGKINHPDEKLDETHVIAVVQDTEGKYSIVDSLTSDAVEKVENAEEVARHVNGRFDTVSRRLSYSVVLTQEEQTRRKEAQGTRGANEPVRVGNGVFI